MKNKIVDCQEEEYWFPYHYVSKMPELGFRQHFLDSWGINYISTIEFMLSRLGNVESESIIDIGCGDGRLTREIALSINPTTLVGVDYSSRAIKLAQAMNQDLERASFHATDITSAHELGSFDAAVLMEVFEHIPLDMANEFMVGVRALIKPGGRLLLTVPHNNKPVEYKHFQHFSVKSLLKYIEVDFDIVDVVPFERRGLSRVFLGSLLSNRLFVLNNSRLSNYIYSLHKEHLFFCKNERECQRIYVEAVAK